jgi:predicted Ser/Thr protein kinase
MAGTESGRCERCGSVLPAGSALGGQCPRCLLELGFEEPGSNTSTIPPLGNKPPSSSSASDEDRFVAGTILAKRYRVLGMAGKGGMGEVYRAYDLKLNQPVALKFLPESTASHPQLLERFHGEVRIARQVSHTNVCRVYDIGEVDGAAYISMEYVDGEDLGSLLRRIGRLPGDKAIEIARKLCAGLAAAHAKGVLHRDLKPANIMIDGRGEALIMDFGLASLAAEIQTGDIRSGTPGYMSPEQRAGKEVTARSDLYSLGLVLHEMFTGKRYGESQHSPSELVKDLDPTIERVILRCLDPEPRRRPSSALNVATALPGGDPIAAALAAGETPSPEMVAASGEKGEFEPRTAVACFAGVVVLLLALVLISNKTTLLGLAPLPLPPDALAFKAREMLKQFGYTGEPVDSAYGFSPTSTLQVYQRYLRAHDFEHRWARLASHQPALTVFWYRQHQDYLQPASFGGPVNSMVTPVDPPSTSEGMLQINLDPKGRLWRLLGAPPSRAQAVAAPTPSGQTSYGQTMDWGSLFSAAGLDLARFTPSAAKAFMPLYADSRMAWVGSYDDGRPDKIRVEAAALHGRPVFFQIWGPWEEPEIASAPLGQRFGNIFGAVLVVALLIAAALAAWRNVRLSRSDKKGAWRIAAFLFSASLATWALVASHVPTPWELYLLLMGLSWAGFQAAFIGLLYLAVEPYVRKNWPDALISSVRIIGGRFRDPLAASHILVGVCAGLFFALLVAATTWVTNDLSGFGSAALSLSGVRFLFGNLLSQLNRAAFFATGLILILVLLRSLVRRTWVGDALFVVLMSSAAFGFGPVAVAFFIALNATQIWILRRFGMLALAALICTFPLAQLMPFAVASWYAALSLTTPLVIASVAAWSLYVILTSRSGMASRLLL